jgi:hypothetical protein
MGWRKYLPTHGERGLYNGPLSTYGEWHSLGHGLYHGLSPDPRPGELPDNKDVQDDPHMFKIGYVVMTVWQVAVVVTILGVVFG